MLFATAVSADCATGHTAFTTDFRDDANADLNDYGRIHVDAEDAACAQNAMYALTDKLRNELDYGSTTFQQWLDGYLVGIIFASAQRIGANGWANKDLDDQMARLETRFQHYTGPPPSGACGGDDLNTCMDDLTGTASAYAWMAAYQLRRPHRNTYTDVQNTAALGEQYLRDALAPVTSSTDRSHGICIRFTPVTSGSATPLCNATIDDLIDGTAETLTVNGQQGLIPYGFGLMSTLGFTKKGLEQAGSSFYFDSDQTAIAIALFEEAQRHIDTSNDFTNDCVTKVNGQLVAGAACGGGGGSYQPNMYRLKPLYDAYFNGIPNAGTYTSDYFDINLFALGSGDMGHFSYGRYVGYGIDGNTWIASLPEMMPGDQYNPIGYFEGVGTSGVAQGWTCDQDKSDGRVKVDFYVDGWTLAAEGFANSSSEPAINSLCGGGNAHRFWVQLPTWTQGKQVRVYGDDYTWYGTTELSCLQSPQCGW